MAYYDGETLDKVLARGPLRVGRALSIAVQAGRGLAAAHDELIVGTMGAAVLADMGEPERAARWVERALVVDADEPIIDYNAACVYVRLSRFDDAIQCLEASVGHGGLSRDWVRNDPDLDPLRGDARFRALVSQPGSGEGAGTPSPTTGEAAGAASAGSGPASG